MKGPRGVFSMKFCFIPALKRGSRTFWSEVLLQVLGEKDPRSFQHNVWFYFRAEKVFEEILAKRFVAGPW